MNKSYYEILMHLQEKGYKWMKYEDGELHFYKKRFYTWKGPGVRYRESYVCGIVDEAIETFRGYIKMISIRKVLRNLKRCLNESKENDGRSIKGTK